MVAILYTQADVNQYTSEDFKASADRMGNGLLAKHDSTGPPKEPAVYSARSGKLLDFSLNRKRPAPSAHTSCCMVIVTAWVYPYLLACRALANTESTVGCS